jgi:hypothetical protein
MEPELKRTLDEIHALAKDNHRMLRAIRRDQWIGLVTKIIFWFIVVVAPLYLYQQYLQPFVTKFTATTGTPTSGFFGLPTTADLQKLINSLKAGK